MNGRSKLLPQVTDDGIAAAAATLAAAYINAHPDELKKRPPEQRREVFADTMRWATMMVKAELTGGERGSINSAAPI